MNVVKTSALKKMYGSKARRIVAVVENHQCVVKRAVGNPKGFPVGEQCSIFLNSPVPVAKTHKRPLQAWVDIPRQRKIVSQSPQDAFKIFQFSDPREVVNRPEASRISAVVREFPAEWFASVKFPSLPVGDRRTALKPQRAISVAIHGKRPIETGVSIPRFTQVVLKRCYGTIQVRFFGRMRTHRSALHWLYVAGRQVAETTSTPSLLYEVFA
jgi:hypothetical protein